MRIANEFLDAMEYVLPALETLDARPGLQPAQPGNLGPGDRHHPTSAGLYPSSGIIPGG